MPIVDKHIDFFDDSKYVGTRKRAYAEVFFHQKVPEPYASIYCQQFDEAKSMADLGSHGKTNEIETHNKKLGLLFATLIRRWLMSKCEIPILDKAYKYRNRKNSGAVLKELADNMLPV
mgnify:CR=1 FL=1